MAKVQYRVKEKGKKRSPTGSNSYNGGKIVSESLVMENNHIKVAIDDTNAIVEPTTQKIAELHKKLLGKKRKYMEPDDKVHEKRDKQSSDLAKMTAQKCDDEKVIQLWKSLSTSKDAWDNSKLNESKYDNSKILMENLNLYTIRQKRKLNYQQLEKQQKRLLLEHEIRRNEQYLRQWKDCRNKWKFEKLRQISVERMMFSELNDDIWPIALEYLSASNGAARKRILQSATAVIDGGDQLCRLDCASDLMESHKYQRARDLLQALN